jgi:23S rRNA-/tRNA-specific pseudouridylate synthase
VSETDHYVVVDKPALLDSQNSKSGRDSVVDWLSEKYGFAGLVHRLDFGTSGLMVCAKNAESARTLTAALQRGDIKRSYLAIVMGKIDRDHGEITTPIDELDAHTKFTVRERFANATLVEVDLVTGRKHQIRRHFSESGYPLLGDHLYAKKGSDRLFHRPALHAFKLVVQGAKYEAAPPEDFQTLLAKLRAIRS